MNDNGQRIIGIIGGGPSAMFALKRLVETGDQNFEINVFERKAYFGSGMPYSTDGANAEHVTNVSDNEIPKLFSSIIEWLRTVPVQTLRKFQIDPDKFSEYQVLPRLLFGQYLMAQFNAMVEYGRKLGIIINLHFSSNVLDIIDSAQESSVVVHLQNGRTLKFSEVIICTGHHWPTLYEGKVKGYYDSPYPPSKLNFSTNHSVAIKGSSLTAIDAIRTLSRQNGSFETDKNGNMSYIVNSESNDFKIIMHSRSGLLPAIRFHLEDSHLSKDSLLTEEEINSNKLYNEGFLSLDFVFKRTFKDAFLTKDQEFYNVIKDLTIEQFVDKMMSLREKINAFSLFKAEYIQAEKSIKRRQSIYWKEMLAVLSFAMNYPAKYFSAEDMLRLQRNLMPLISIVIAFVPQNSAQELIALHEAGIIDIVQVGDESEVIPGDLHGATYHYKDEFNEEHSIHYQTFIDCVGQPHLDYKSFPFKSMLENRTISQARVRFRTPHKADEEGEMQVNVDRHKDGLYLKVPGIAINDNFQLIDEYGAYNKRIYIMAVPYIGGFNPDYSGLDFCEAASSRIMTAILKTSM